MLIDVHCHLDFLEKEGIKVEQAIKNARKNKVKIIICNGVNPEQNKKILALAEEYSEVKPAIGVYPIDALKLSNKQIDEEINFIKKNKNKIIAIGEIGLDFKEDQINQEKQKEVFAKFIDLAKELNLPISVHSRKAELETIELLEELKAKKVHMHCFMGKIKLAERIAKNGWYLSIPSCVKYNEQFQLIIQKVPIENLLAETDSPYLHPDKKWPNEPAKVIESYKKIAEIKKLPLKEVEKIIESNFKNLFMNTK